MNRVKKIIDQFSSFFPLSVLQTVSGQKCLFPFYHAISDTPLPFIDALYQHKTVAAFEKDLDFLCKNYQSISLESLIQKIHTGSSLAGYFHLSFDDGLSNFYHVIAPILRERNIHATVFLNADFIDNKSLFYRYKASLLYHKIQQLSIAEQQDIVKQFAPHHNNIKEFLKGVNYENQDILNQIARQVSFSFNSYLQRAQPYLSSQQIKSLYTDGFSFGSHSCDHPLYNKLPLTTQIQQTVDSTNFVQQQFDIPYRIFSFPFTDYGISKAFFEQMLETEKQLDLSFGCAGVKHDWHPHHIQRLDMELNGTDPKKIIHSELLYYIVKSMFGKNKIKRF